MASSVTSGDDDDSKLDDPPLLKGLLKYKKKKGEEIEDSPLVTTENDPLWVIMCSYCLSTETDADRMVSKEMKLSKKDLTYLWTNTKPAEGTSGVSTSGNFLSPRIRPKAFPLFSAQVNSAICPRFYLLFHMYNIANPNTQIRLLTIPVELDNLECIWIKPGEGPSPRTVRDHCIQTMELGGCEIVITYYCRKYPTTSEEPDDTVLAIKGVKMSLTKFDAIVDYMQSNGDRVTMRYQGREYCGRPNKIETKGFSRFYGWQSNDDSFEEDDFQEEEGVERVERSNDLREIEDIDNPYSARKSRRDSGPISQIVSPRKGQKKRLSIVRPRYVPDNDDISNPIAMPSFELRSPNDLFVELFNFRYFPVRVLRYKVSYIDVVNAYVAVRDGNRTLKKSSSPRKAMSLKNLTKVFKKKKKSSVEKGELLNISLQVGNGEAMTLLCRPLNATVFEIMGIGVSLHGYAAKFSR